MALELFTEQGYETTTIRQIAEPETNGCAERFIRTLKEQCLWAELHDTVDDLRRVVAAWTHTNNTEWLIQRHGHQTPPEAFASVTSEVAA